MKYVYPVPMKKTQKSDRLTLILFLSILFSCNTSDKILNEKNSFLGEDQAIEQAKRMFEAIGGTRAWCNLKSLYIRAEHSEPQLNMPYQSEIWRAMDTFELVIEQQSDEMHVKGVFTETGGTIRYYDHRDTTRILSEEQLQGWKFSHNHNVYVLLHQLGCDPQAFRVEWEDDKRLNFYRETDYLVGFELDTENRPYLFFPPTEDGGITGSIFNQWGTDQGLVHSAGGHPLDSSFFYTTQSWIPNKESLVNAFGAEILKID